MQVPDGLDALVSHDGLRPMPQQVGPTRWNATNLSLRSQRIAKREPWRLRLGVTLHGCFCMVSLVFACKSQDDGGVAFQVCHEVETHGIAWSEPSIWGCSPPKDHLWKTENWTKCCGQHADCCVLQETSEWSRHLPGSFWRQAIHARGHPKELEGPWWPVMDWMCLVWNNWIVHLKFIVY